MIAVLGPLGVAVVMIALGAVISRLTPDERTSGVLGSLVPTVPVLLLYGILVVAAFLSMTGLRRFLPVRLLSYVLALPWYALESYAMPTGDVVTISVILVSLGIPVILRLATLPYSS
jgi:hypothetical protein